MLKPGAGVVTSRADVHYVVTEFGTAKLFGKNLRERAEALIQERLNAQHHKALIDAFVNDLESRDELGSFSG